MSKIEILEEKSENSDLFSARTHEKVAKTLEDIITSHEGDGLTIGLEGSWGSGKSTVISILIKNLKNENSIASFYFDAWAHEGDPLRRIFLESMLEKIKFNEKKERDRIKGLITNRVKETTINSSQTATGLGKLLAISLFLASFGSTILSAVQKEYILSFDTSKELHFIAIIGLFLAAAPLLILLGNLLQLLFRYRTKAFQTKNWRFLQGESSQTLKQETSEDNERSSIEFQKYFTEIVEKSHDEIEKIVIIIDNLDRIDAKDTLKIWSTLQTFLQKSNPLDRDQHLTKKIWIVVPYDPDALRKVWEQNSENNQTAKSFFEKFFQLRIDVPKLLPSGWEEFARNCINKSLKTNDEQETEKIINLLKITRESINHAPSPREIKIFANQVSLYKSHRDNIQGDKISIEAISLFVVVKYLEFRTNENFEKELVAGNIPNSSYSKMMPESIRKELAGLLFGVSQEKGIQLLLEPEIETFLKEGRIEEIKQLEKTHQKTFWFVFDLHIKDIQSFDLLAEYSQTIRISFFDNKKENLQNYILNLDEKSRLEKTIPFPQKDKLNALESSVYILKKSDKNIANVREKIAHSFKDAIQKPDNFDHIEDLGEQLYTLLNEDDESPTPSIEISGLPIRIWIKWSEIKQKKHKGLIKPNELVYQEILEIIKSTNNIPKGMNSLLRLVKKSQNIDSSLIQEPLKRFIYTNRSKTDLLNSDFFDLLTEAIFILEISPEQIENQYSMSNLINVSDNRIAVGIITAKVYQDIPFNPYNNGYYSEQQMRSLQEFWESQNEENAKKCWELAKEYDDYNFIWKVATNPKNALTKDIIKLAKEEKNLYFFHTEDSIRNLNICTKIFTNEQDMQKEIAEFILKSENFHENFKKSIDSTTSLIERVQEIGILISLDSTPETAQIIQEKLQQINKDEWTKILKDNNELIEMTLILKSKQENFYLSTPFSNAISEYLEKHIFEQEDNKYYTENLEKIFSLLEKNELSRNKIKNSENIADKGFECQYKAIKRFYEYLDFSQILNSHKQQLVKKIGSYSKNKNIDELRIILLVVNSLVSPKSDLLDEQRNTIANPLRESYSKANESDKEVIEQAAKIFKVDLDKSEE